MNNNHEIYLNDIVMEKEIIEEFGIQPSLKTKKNVNVDEGKEKIKENLKFYIFKRKSGERIVEMHYVGHFIM